MSIDRAHTYTRGMTIPDERVRCLECGEQPVAFVVEQYDNGGDGHDTIIPYCAEHLDRSAATKDALLREDGEPFVLHVHPHPTKLAFTAVLGGYRRLRAELAGVKAELEEYQRMHNTQYGLPDSEG